MNKRKRDCEALLAIGRLQILLEKNRNALDELVELARMIRNDEAPNNRFLESVEKLKEQALSQLSSRWQKAELYYLTDYAREEGKDYNRWDAVMSMTIEELDFSARTYNVLRKAGLENVGDLIEIPMEFFKQGKDAKGVKLHGMGPKCQEEILFKLGLLGLEPGSF